MSHNTSEQPLDPRFLRKHPRSYTEEPMVGKIEFNDPTFRPAEDKLGGRNQMREKIAELIRELEKERKRSSRWKAKAKEQYNSLCDEFDGW